MDKKLAETVKKEMLKNSASKKLDESERESLMWILRGITENEGEEEEIEGFQAIKDSLSPGEIQQLQELWLYILDDDVVYPSVSVKLLKDDIPLLKKIYNLLIEKNLLDDNWEAMDAFEKICF